MRHRISILLALLATTILPAGAGQGGRSPAAEPPAGDVAKIRQAAPSAAPAKPLKPRKLLVFSRADGFYHESIPWGAAALRILGEKTGAYSAVLSDDPAMFDRATLDQFDAVVMNNNCGNPIADPKRRANLLDFVRGGRGLVGIHCAAHLDWPEYTAMLGAYSISHPWNAGSTVSILLEEPDHPVVRCFGGRPFAHTDEIFVFKDFSRDNVRVLLRLNNAATDMNKPGADPKGDYPLAWVRQYGHGRVFYTALGHQNDVYWRPAVLAHYLAGIQFALGDLPAPAASRDAYNERYRPQFHFTARKGWISDVNGLVYYDGEYHLGYQHNPHGPELDYLKIHWGHAVSRNLVQWQELPPSIAPDANGPAFSGSAVVDRNNTSGLKTGRDPPLVAFYTGARYMLPDRRDGVVCMAYSNDRGRTWTKYAKNPVVEAITHYNRDPKVFWHAPSRRWVMAITLSCANHWLDGDYRFALLTSQDLKSWRLSSRLELPRGLDCPDMFELPVDYSATNRRWVFWAGDGTHALGTFDGTTFRREGPIRLPLLTWEENGAVGYAAQTFNDIPPELPRVVQIGWLRHGAFPGMPFSQQLSFPCELRLRTTGKGLALCRVPVHEIASLYGKPRRWKQMTPAPGQNVLAGMSGGLFHLRAEIEPGASRRVNLRAYGQTLSYDAAAQKLSCGGKSVELPLRDGRFRIEALIDRTSLEVFADDGRVCMAYCFLPPGPEAELSLTAEGGSPWIVSMEVFPLRSMWDISPAKERRDE